MKCRCGAEMVHIAREKDYGDTVGRVWWCRSCGRARVTRYDIGGNQPDETTWHEPDIQLMGNTEMVARLEVEHTGEGEIE